MSFICLASLQLTVMHEKSLSTSSHVRVCVSLLFPEQQHDVTQCCLSFLSWSSGDHPLLYFCRFFLHWLCACHVALSFYLLSGRQDEFKWERIQVRKMKAQETQLSIVIKRAGGEWLTDCRCYFYYCRIASPQLILKRVILITRYKSSHSFFLLSFPGTEGKRDDKWNRHAVWDTHNEFCLYIWEWPDEKNSTEIIVLLMKWLHRSSYIPSSGPRAWFGIDCSFISSFSSIHLSTRRLIRSLVVFSFCQSDDDSRRHGKRRSNEKDISKKKTLISLILDSSSFCSLRLLLRLRHLLLLCWRNVFGQKRTWVRKK
jgi:hypothetical protein